MMRLALPLSDTLALLHAPSIAEGKTAPMAKGLFLCERDRVYAGESAGFGAPVWKCGQRTVFPSLVSIRLLTPNMIETVYRLNLTATWQILGIAAPRAFSTAMETITTIFMRQPTRQQFWLRVRDALCAVFQIRSTMTPDCSQGECRVRYAAAAQRLNVTVDAQALPRQGELILLNEVSGAPFNRLHIGQRIQEGREIPAWQSCPFETMFANPADRLGFALIIPPDAESVRWQLACGREIARGLNWAGFALTTAQRRFSYAVHFKEGIF